MEVDDPATVEERVAELERRVELLTDMLVNHAHGAHGGLGFASPIGPLWKLRNRDDLLPRR